MKQGVKNSLISSIIITVAIGIGGVLLNRMYPINFTAYFIICILSLALCGFIKKQQGLIIPWFLTATASVLVTINYLHPDISVYSNADYHVLALQGVNKQDSIILIGKNKSMSFYDDEHLEGDVVITPNKENDGRCILNYNLSAEPLYMAIPDNITGKLINQDQLPSFKYKLTLEDDSLLCDINLQYGEKDTVSFHISFKNQANKIIRIDTLGFRRPINIGYNLYDILHTDRTYSVVEENLLQSLRNTSLVRNIEDISEHVFYITYNQSLERLKLSCDGKIVQADKRKHSVELHKDTHYYIGYGGNATRPFRVSHQNGTIRLRYQFPYLNNFPRSSIEEGFKENSQKMLAITSDTRELLKTNINEAFYYFLFKNPDNEYIFSGNINYWINDSRTSFKASLICNTPQSADNANVLKSRNGAEWIFETCNLREKSPITCKSNIWVQDFTVLGLVFLFLFMSFAASMICCREEHRSIIVMTVWLFAIPFLVLRIYLLWRIAVFPPVNNITLNEFLRYRMEMASIWKNPVTWTLITVGALFLFSAFNIFPNWLRKSIKKLRFAKRYHLIYGFFLLAILISPIPTLLQIKTIVGLNIVVPVIAFLINEYISLRWLSIWYRIGNALAALLALFICDPGYAIMFFIFECFYFSVLLYSLLIRKPVSLSNSKTAGTIFHVVLLLVVVICILWAPQIVAYAYSTEPSLLPFINKSRLFFIAMPLIVGSIIVWTIKIWQDGRKKTILFGSIIILFAISVSSSLGYDYLHQKNLHFKYRTIIHTKKVGEIMQDEEYAKSNSQRLLNAAQNQWFLQYHYNKGKERINDKGILSLLPHFKKGVTWNTQISDVILSRYIIAELSGVVPLVIIVFTLVFLCIVFSRDNKSSAGKVLTLAIAFLFTIQTTFVWMAVTNRTIFFGQDFPFLTQNARSTLVMFGVWLVLLIYFASHIPDDYEENTNLRDGLRKFALKQHQGAFFFLFIALIVTIAITGNKYSDLYASEGSKEDPNDAAVFNLSEAMDLSSQQLQEINACLAKYPANNRKMESNEDISELVDSIEKTIYLSDCVEKLKDNGAINEFTYSLFQAFTKNLKHCNSNANIIHLRRHDANTYELGMNKGFFSLQTPDFDKQAWKGNVYTDVVAEQGYSPTKLNGNYSMSIYAVPQSWMPHNSNFAIIDNRTSYEQYRITMHKKTADYYVKTSVFCITPDDMLEISDQMGKNSFAYQYGKNENNLMVKNMVINGRRKFFYPLEEKCMWLRGFANLVAKSKQGSASGEPVYVTLDYELTKSISDSLIATGSECSVVALDGHGNVRLMVDNKLAEAINPNDEELIEELIEQNYLNPSSVKDQNFFGNLNLCYMNPGPGSSLKPITYAAVTSQSQDIDWKELKLLSPSTNDSIKEEDGKYLVRQFGPEYKYPAQRAFRSITKDEKGKDLWIDNHLYISKSSNYYNALITYLGLYDNLENAENKVFVQSNDSHDFPRFKTGKSIWTFRNAPTSTANQILFNGLTRNFHIPTFVGWIDSTRYEFIDTKLYHKETISAKSKLASSFSWVFPQPSTIYSYEMQSPKMSPAERLRQYTLGAPPVKVTPIKMAEMYGKLFSLHRDYHANIMPHYAPYHELWQNSDGVALTKAFDFYKQNLYKGMELCTTEGTASKILKGVGSNYFLYAKTGTLNIGTQGGGKIILDDKMLAVIICDKDILKESITSTNDYKFYVVYFRYKQTGTMPKAGNIIDAIIKSNSFKQYMKQ